MSMQDPLEGFEFKNFEDIPDFKNKLIEFLSQLDAYARTHDKQIVPVPIAGYACLDGGKIIAIAYYLIPPKSGSRTFINRLFPKKVETGAVVMKEYVGQGIYRKLASYRKELMRSRGFKEKEK